MKATEILKKCDLLKKTDCFIYKKVLYERCKFNDNFYTKNEFINTKDETYYLDREDTHVYRFFFNEDDYDYVTDEKLLKKLNKKKTRSR